MEFLVAPLIPLLGLLLLLAAERLESDRDGGSADGVGNEPAPNDDGRTLSARDAA
jgi:hypothetical protein